MQCEKMMDLDLQGKTLLIREDFNVPLREGKVQSDARLKAAMFTIEQALDAGATVLLMSHLGRPTEGVPESVFSLQPVAQRLSELLGREVGFIADWIEGVKVQPGSVTLLENVRFLTGEKSNDPQLAKKMASLCDIFVMDAFGTAHRKHASTYGVAEYANMACAGPLLIAEVEALSHALVNPQKPLVAIVGGSKVSSKLEVLKSIIRLADILIVGGGIANTFLAAQGIAIGQSLYEEALVPQANMLLEYAHQQQTLLPLPSDAIVAEAIANAETARITTVDKLSPSEMILDIGPETQQRLKAIVASAQTIVWNGPVGVFEVDAFSQGTKVLAKAIADNPHFSIAGGGDTLAAIDRFIEAHQVSYISTGGGAFLEFMEHQTLPILELLSQRFLIC